MILSFLVVIFSSTSLYYLIQIKFSEHEITCLNKTNQNSEINSELIRLLRSEAYIDRVIKINSLNGAVIVTLSSFAYRNLTLNWIASLKRLGHIRCVVFCIDDDLALFLSERGLTNQIAILPKQWRNGIVGFNHVHILSTTQIRFIFWHQLSVKAIKFLYSDVDLVFMTNNVIGHFQYVDDTTLAEIIFTRNEFGHERGFLTSGVFYASPTEFTKHLFWNLIHSPGISDIQGSDIRLGSINNLFDTDGFVYVKEAIDEASDDSTLEMLMFQTCHSLSIDEKSSQLKKLNYWFIENENRNV
jgi:hypothetical protein